MRRLMRLSKTICREEKMMNNENGMIRERRISLTDFLWQMLEQWRAILALGLVIGLLFPSVLYVLEMKNYREKTSTQDESEDAAVRQLTQDDLNLLKTLTFYSLWESKREYYENSYLMNVDGTNERRLAIQYYLKADDPRTTDIFSIANYYSGLNSDNAFMEKMAGIIKVRDIKYLRELFVITASNSEKSESGQPGALVNVVVFLPDGTDYEKIRTEVTEYFDSLRNLLSPAMGAYSVNLLYSDVMTYNNQTRIDSQIDSFVKMQSAETNYQKAYEALSAQDKSIVDALVEKGNVRKKLTEIRTGFGQDAQYISLIEKQAEMENGDGAEEDGEAFNLAEDRLLKKPTFRFLYVIVGFVLSVFLYGGIYFCYLVIDDHLKDEEDAANLTGTRSYGGIFLYPYTTPLQKFIHDKRIYNRRHGVKGGQVRSAGRLADRIVSKAEHMGTDAVTMISLGKSSAGIDRILGQQEKYMREDCGLQVQQISAAGGPGSIREEAFNHLSPVCIVVLSGRTSVTMLTELIDRLQEYNVPVLGSIFVEA